jgi:alkylated DNA repair protein (DNA oxidative demethylase)
MRPTLALRGVQVFQVLLDRGSQNAILSDIRDIMAKAPLFSPKTPSGKPMSVQMTSAGDFGWVSDKSGYRYAPNRPNGTVWPEIPSSVHQIWDQVSGSGRRPECCLVNLYRDGAKMGMHQDRDEAEFGEPVVSVSLGDDALFRIGNLTRGGSTESIWLKSGDVVVMGGVMPASFITALIKRGRDHRLC